MCYHFDVIVRELNKAPGESRRDSPTWGGIPVDDISWIPYPSA